MDEKKIISNRGFSMVELIIIIAIMAVLSSAIVVSVFSALERAKETRALTNAKKLYEASQIAIADISVRESAAFNYALKY